MSDTKTEFETWYAANVKIALPLSVKDLIWLGYNAADNTPIRSAKRSYMAVYKALQKPAASADVNNYRLALLGALETTPAQTCTCGGWSDIDGSYHYKNCAKVSP